MLKGLSNARLVAGKEDHPQDSNRTKIAAPQFEHPMKMMTNAFGDDMEKEDDMDDTFTLGESTISSGGSQATRTTTFTDIVDDGVYFLEEQAITSIKYFGLNVNRVADIALDAMKIMPLDDEPRPLDDRSCSSTKRDDFIEDRSIFTYIFSEENSYIYDFEQDSVNNGTDEDDSTGNSYEHLLYGEDLDQETLEESSAVEYNEDIEIEIHDFRQDSSTVEHREETDLEDLGQETLEDPSAAKYKEEFANEDLDKETIEETSTKDCREEVVNQNKDQETLEESSTVEGKEEDRNEDMDRETLEKPSTVDHNEEIIDEDLDQETLVLQSTVVCKGETEIANSPQFSKEMEKTLPESTHPEGSKDVIYQTYSSQETIRSERSIRTMASFKSIVRLLKPATFFGSKNATNSDKETKKKSRIKLRVKGHSSATFSKKQHGNKVDARCSVYSREGTPVFQDDSRNDVATASKTDIGIVEQRIRPPFGGHYVHKTPKIADSGAWQFS